MTRCRWFALCDEPAAGTVQHPVLDPVPTCKRCADRLELELEPYEPESFVCREGHWHDGVRGSDGSKCPEERVSDLVAAGMEYGAAVEAVFGGV